MKKKICFGFYLSFFFFTLAICASGQVLTIGNNTNLFLGSAILNYAGDWINYGTLNAQNGAFIFNGQSGDQSITNANGETFWNVTVNKSTGNLILSNDVTINGTITLTSGDVDLNGSVITLGSTASLSESSGSTVKGTSGYITTTRDINTPNNSNVGGLGAVITSSANLSSTQIKRFHSDPVCNGGNGILRSYEISPSNNSGLAADFTFIYDESELNGISESSLQMFRSTDGGTSWYNQGGNLNVAANQITLNGVDAFSKWALSVNSAPVLANIEAADAEFTEGELRTNVTESIDITDIDDVNIESAEVKISSNYWIDQDVLEFEDIYNISGVWNGSTGTLTLTGTDTKAHYQSALRSVFYHNTSEDPVVSITDDKMSNSSRRINVSPRTVSFKIYDGNDYSNTQTRNINIVNVNDGPVMAVNEGAEVDEGSVVVLTNDNLQAEDVDGGSVSIRYYIQDLPSHGFISKEEFTQNDVNLGRIFYTHDGSETTSDSFIFYLLDVEGGRSANYTFSITIKPVEDFVNQPEGISYYFDEMGNIVLSWNDNSNNENGFVVWRNQITSAKLKTLAEYQQIAVLPPNSTTFTDSNIQEGINYNYLVTAFVEEITQLPQDLNQGGQVTTTAPLSTPTNLSAAANSDESISITWDDNSTLESGYKLERRSTGDWEKIADLAENSSEFIDRNAAVGITYYYRVKAYCASNESVYSNECSATCIVTDIANDNEEILNDFILKQNFPNPFNPNTVIRFALPEAVYVKLGVYNLLGQTVTILVDEYKSAGFYEIILNAEKLNSGIYLYKIQAGNFVQTKKCILIK